MADPGKTYSQIVANLSLDMVEQLKTEYPQIAHNNVMNDEFIDKPGYLFTDEIDKTDLILKNKL